MKAVIVDASHTLSDDERQRYGLGLVNGAVVDVPQALLAEREAKGIDVFDEVWEGVLHMVSPPLSEHQNIAGELYVLLHRAARARDLVARYEIGFLRAADDYRKPDLAVFRPEHQTREGLSAAGLVIEIRSPRDETDLKIPWYAARGVAEIVAISQKSRAVELYAGRDGKAIPVPPDDDGGIELDTVGMRLAPVDVVDGRRLLVTGDGVDELV